jgi:probable HAF family extracellular repeat protein
VNAYQRKDAIMTRTIARRIAALPRLLLSMARGALPALLPLLLLAPPAQAAPTYTVTVLGGAGSAALDINEAGQVAGYITSGDSFHAFFYDGAVLTDLGTLGYERSIARGLNDDGTVVGTAYGDGIERQAFVYAGGVVSVLPFAGFSEANDINNAGLVVGAKAFPDGQGDTYIHGYKYAVGEVTDLGTVPDGYNSFAYGVNEAGYVTGTVEVGGAPNYPSHPFLYTTGPLQDLGDFDGVFSHGYAINNHDQVVGTAGRFSSDELPGDIYPRRAFLYENGVLQDLGSLLNNGSSIAYDINDAGLIVGVSATVDENIDSAFLYVDGAMVLLDSLIDPAAGWTMQSADGINELGQIAGTACQAGLCYAVRLDLAPAIPETATPWMLGAGLVGLGLARRARSRNCFDDARSGT